MRRAELWWALMEPVARPVVVVSRDAHVEARSALLAAPVTARARGTASEIPLGPEDGVFKPCVVNAAGVGLIAKSRLVRRIGLLSPAKRAALDAALRFSLGLE
jgi:mRNA-degrading endonuclease toxin of MazEF toxin-antitoxin module